MNNDLTPAQFPTLPKRDKTGHKGDYGRVLLIGGSTGMAGSIALSAMGALRGGAGLVTVATSEAALSTVASFDPCYMTVPLVCDSDGRILHAARQTIETHASTASVVAIGPGLGRSDSLNQLLADLYLSLDKTMVIDADGINALAEAGVLHAERPGNRILTPHPGEFSRLIGQKISGRQQICEAATKLSAAARITLLLKGQGTLVTDGYRKYINPTGNPGMATGGSGDVLTGLVAAILAGGFKSFEAICIAAYIHGWAGDLAASRLGQISMTALDLVRFLPEAFQEFDKIPRG